MSITLRVYGTPAPQGSKRGFVRGGQVRLVEASKGVRPWREAIVSQIIRDGLNVQHLEHPVTIRVTFWFARPQAHYGRRNGERYLKENAPVYRAGTPDLDKLLRSTGDGLVQGGLLRDDDLIVEWHARKMWAEQSGAVLEIAPAIL